MRRISWAVEWPIMTHKWDKALLEYDMSCQSDKLTQCFPNREHSTVKTHFQITTMKSSSLKYEQIKTKCLMINKNF